MKPLFYAKMNCALTGGSFALRPISDLEGNEHRMITTQADFDAASATNRAALDNVTSGLSNTARFQIANGNLYDKNLIRDQNNGATANYYLLHRKSKSR